MNSIRFAVVAWICLAGITPPAAADARWAQWDAAAAVSPVPRHSAPSHIAPTEPATPAEALLAMPLPTAGAGPQGGGTPSAHVDMFVGETRIFPAPDVARIAVGDGGVVHAAVADEREVVVFARSPGTVSLVVWTKDGDSRNLHIKVVADDVRRIQTELAGFLERIPNARSAVVGDKLIIEGDDLSDADQARIADLAKRYPQVVDFTGQVGWDRMVLIDVQVLEMPRSRVRDLGIRWDPTSAGGVSAGAVWDVGAGGPILARPGAAALDAAFPTLGAAGYLGLNALLSSRLHALTQSGEAVLLAQPQLMARSGSTASFLAGGELPYTNIDANGNTSTVFKPYGVTLDVTPRIDRNGTVRASIEVEVSAVDPVVNTPSGPALRTRRTVTEFNVRSGQTLVLSGFLSRERVEDVDSVPGLGGIPVLGALFRATRTQRRDTELAIFVTPVIVDGNHPDVAARASRGRAIVDEVFPRAPRVLTPVRHDPFLLESP